MSAPETESAPTAFEKAAADRSGGVLREYFDLLRYNKKWWLTPIVLVLLAIGVLLILGGTAAAPLIYAIF